MWGAARLSEPEQPHTDGRLLAAREEVAALREALQRERRAADDSRRRIDALERERGRVEAQRDTALSQLTGRAESRATTPRSTPAAATPRLSDAARAMCVEASRSLSPLRPQLRAPVERWLRPEAEPKHRRRARSAPRSAIPGASQAEGRSRPAPQPSGLSLVSDLREQVSAQQRAITALMEARAESEAERKRACLRAEVQSTVSRSATRLSQLYGQQTSAFVAELEEVGREPDGAALRQRLEAFTKRASAVFAELQALSKQARVKDARRPSPSRFASSRSKRESSPSASPTPAARSRPPPQPTSSQAPPPGPGRRSSGWRPAVCSYPAVAEDSDGRETPPLQHLPAPVSDLRQRPKQGPGADRSGRATQRPRPGPRSN